MASGHIVKSYDEELRKLSNTITEMGAWPKASSPRRSTRLSNATASWRPSSSKQMPRSTSFNKTSTIWQ